MFLTAGFSCPSMAIAPSPLSGPLGMALSGRFAWFQKTSFVDNNHCRISSQGSLQASLNLLLLIAAASSLRWQTPLRLSVGSILSLLLRFMAAPLIDQDMLQMSMGHQLAAFEGD